MSSSYTISRYRMDGTVAGTEELSGDFFGRLSKGNTSALLHQVAVAMMANVRQPIAHTKRRGEVQGGGKKPWKQKGTGRARVGSIRSPLWKGGGVVFGPRSNRNYTQKINAKMKHKAFLAALKEHLDGNALAILEVDAEAPKTKTMATTLKKIRSSWSPPHKALLMLCSQSSDATVRRMTRNIVNTTVEDIATLSVMDVLRYPYLLLTPAAFELLKKRIQK